MSEPIQHQHPRTNNNNLGSRGNNNNQNKIFIRGLHKKTNQSRLFQFLSSYTQIHSLRLKRKHQGGDCTGYGWLTTTDEGYKMLISLKSLSFNNRKITLAPFLRGENLQNHLQKINSKRIFVSHVPRSFAIQDFRQLFSQFGDIDTAYWRSVPGMHSHIGVVFFYNSPDAVKAHDMVNEHPERFHGMKVCYRYVNLASLNQRGEQEERVSRDRDVADFGYQREEGEGVRAETGPGDRMGWVDFSQGLQNDHFLIPERRSGETDEARARWTNQSEIPQEPLRGPQHPRDQPFYPQANNNTNYQENVYNRQAQAQFQGDPYQQTPQGSYERHQQERYDRYQPQGNHPTPLPRRQPNFQDSSYFGSGGDWYQFEDKKPTKINYKRHKQVAVNHHKENLNFKYTSDSEATSDNSSRSPKYRRGARRSSFGMGARIESIINEARSSDESSGSHSSGIHEGNFGHAGIRGHPKTAFNTQVGRQGRRKANGRIHLKYEGSRIRALVRSSIKNKEAEIGQEGNTSRQEIRVTHRYHQNQDYTRSAHYQYRGPVEVPPALPRSQPGLLADLEPHQGSSDGFQQRNDFSDPGFTYYAENRENNDGLNDRKFQSLNF